MKNNYKYIIDIIMVILLITLILNQFTGVLFHEILGICTLIAFVMHHVLNKNFYRNVFKGRLTKLKVAFLIIDSLLFVMIIIMIISSFLISEYVFSFLGITKHITGRILHIISAYSIYLLCALHLGLHYNTVIKLKKEKKSILTLFLIIFAIIFGINGFIKKEIFSKLTLRSLYPLHSDDNPIIIFIDYLGIFIMFIVIGYGIFQLITFKKNGEKQNE